MTGLPIAAALDIGGTMFKAALITEGGETLAVERMVTPSQSPPDRVADLVVDTVQRLLSQAGLDLDRLPGIGISIAAFITPDGVVTATAHLSSEWIGFDLRECLLPRLPARYYFSLDTPAPALGEAHYGAGRGVQDFAYVTVSTGIGAGIISGGRLYTGGAGWAGGVGHIIVDPLGPRTCKGCGNRGCLETFAAKQGVLALAEEEILRHPNGLLALQARAAPLSPMLIAEAAQQGDEAAVQVFERAGHYLGLGLTSLIDILSPRLVVLGGGIAQAGDLLLEPARRVVRRCAFPPRHRRVEIVQAALGDLSGVFGAAAMVFHDIRVELPA